ncbi:MAG: AAA family ATPase, partial [Acidimicrobiia bacterium]
VPGSVIPPACQVIAPSLGRTHPTAGVGHADPPRAGDARRWDGMKVRVGLETPAVTVRAMMTPGEVHRILDVLERVEVRAWVEGGWGIDALAGRETRAHGDLDLAVDTAADGFERAVAALTPDGYEWGVNDLPIRLVLEAADGRSVDLHPIRFEADGAAYQRGHDREYRYPADCFTIGRIDGREVACLGVRIQREFHSGYVPRSVDRHDLPLLDEAELTADPSGVIVVSGIPGAGKTTVAGMLARRFAAGVHLEADRLQMMVMAGGRWAGEGPMAEWNRQLQIRTRVCAAAADVWRSAGFVPVIDDIYVSRGRTDLLIERLEARPVRLVVLAADPNAALTRDAQRPDKTVGEQWLQLDAIQRDELAGVGLWIDSTDLTAEQTVDRIVERLDSAIIAE